METSSATAKALPLGLALVALTLWVMVIFFGPQPPASPGVSLPRVDLKGVAAAEGEPGAASPDAGGKLIWGRDPFLVPPGVEARAAKTEPAPLAAAGAATPWRPPAVSAILISNARRSAIIDGKIVGVGDRIGDAVIVAISLEGVKLRRAEGVILLPVPEPQVGVSSGPVQSPAASRQSQERRSR